jgi:hypothetical protein
MKCPGSVAKAPAGGQKIVIYDLATGAVIRRVPLDGVADRKGSFLNDIAVDEAGKRAFISDSGFRSAPDNMTGIITYDFATGALARVCWIAILRCRSTGTRRSCRMGNLSGKVHRC